MPKQTNIQAESIKLEQLFDSLATKEYFPLQKRRNPECQFKLYPLSQFQQLIEDAKEEDKKQIFRFLVDTNFDLWFALEGTPNRSTPAHYQMAAFSAGEKCLSAGNISINDENEIISINHKSGDFRPDFASLALPLSILMHQLNDEQNQFKMADKIIVEKLNGSGGQPVTHKFSLNEAKEWAEPIPKNPQQKDNIETITLAPPLRQYAPESPISFPDRKRSSTSEARENLINPLQEAASSSSLSSSPFVNTPNKSQRTRFFSSPGSSTTSSSSSTTSSNQPSSRPTRRGLF